MIYWLNDWLIDGPTNHQSFLSTPPLYHPPPLITPSYHPLLPPPLTTPSYHPLLSPTPFYHSPFQHPLLSPTPSLPPPPTTPSYHPPPSITHPLLPPPLITHSYHHPLSPSPPPLITIPSPPYHSPPHHSQVDGRPAAPVEEDDDENAAQEDAVCMICFDGASLEGNLLHSHHPLSCPIYLPHPLVSRLTTLSSPPYHHHHLTPSSPPPNLPLPPPPPTTRQPHRLL